MKDLSNLTKAAHNDFRAHPASLLMVVPCDETWRRFWQEDASSQNHESRNSSECQGYPPAISVVCLCSIIDQLSNDDSDGGAPLEEQIQGSTVLGWRHLAGVDCYWLHRQVTLKMLMHWNCADMISSMPNPWPVERRNLVEWQVCTPLPVRWWLDRQIVISCLEGQFVQSFKLWWS